MGSILRGKRKRSGNTVSLEPSDAGQGVAAVDRGRQCGVRTDTDPWATLGIADGLSTTAPPPGCVLGAASGRWRKDPHLEDRRVWGASECK